MYITPIKAVCSPNKQTRKIKDGTQFCLRYYVDFSDKFVSCGVNLTDQQKQEVYDEYKKLCYKYGEVIHVEKSEINDFMMRNFRYVEPVIDDYPEKDVPIPPYILGLWLGDGHSHKPSLTNIDKVIIDAWKQYANDCGMRITLSSIKPRKTKVCQHETETVCDYNIVGEIGKQNSNHVLSKLQKLKLIKNKHIPEIYLKNSIEVRRELLAGLLDTDGSLASHGKYEISQKNKQLSENIVQLSKSLGLYTQINETTKKCTNSKSNPQHEGTYYRIYIRMYLNTPNIPVKCERKKTSMVNANHQFYPIFDQQGNVIEAKDKEITKWDEKLIKELIITVEKFKVLEPNQRIPWKKLYVLNPNLPRCKGNSMRSMYREVDHETKNIYQQEIEEAELDLSKLIEKSWLKTYKSIEEKWLNNKTISIPELNWIIGQRNYINDYNPYIIKKQLLNKLFSLQPKSNVDNLVKTLEYIRNEIQANGEFENVVLLKNNKLYIPTATKYNSVGMTVNNMLSFIRGNSISKTFDDLNNKAEIKNKYEYILDDYHFGDAECRKDMVLQMDNNKNILKHYLSCKDAARSLCVLNSELPSAETLRKKISEASKYGKKECGYYWASWLVYYKQE